MANIYKKNSKATVCKGNTCVTIYGDVAKIIEGIVVTAVALLAIVLMKKALK